MKWGGASLYVLCFQVHLLTGFYFLFIACSQDVCEVVCWCSDPKGSSLSLVPLVLWLPLCSFKQSTSCRTSGWWKRPKQQKELEWKQAHFKPCKYTESHILMGNVPLVESKNSCSLPGVPSSSSYSWACRIISRRSNCFTSLASGLVWCSNSCMGRKYLFHLIIPAIVRAY